MISTEIILKVGDRVRMIMIPGGGGSYDFHGALAEILSISSTKPYYHVNILVLDGSRKGIKTIWKIDGKSWTFRFDDWDE